MRVYVYDGSFEGLLTVFHGLFRDKAQPLAIHRRGAVAQGFLAETVEVEADPAKADALYKTMERRMTSRAVRLLYLAHLSEECDGEMRLFAFVHRGWQLGERLLDDLGDPRVAAVMRMANRVERERERFLGLVRFRDAGTFFYAPIEPTCRLLPLLGDHFVRRLPSMKWMIHDVGRKEALVYNEEEWYLTPCDLSGVTDFGSREKYYQHLWRTYFAVAAVESRKNPKRQRNRMPKKVWKWLVEISQGKREPGA